MKFEIKDLKDGGYYLWDKSCIGYYLISLGNIELHKEDFKNKSHCLNIKNTFDYHGIDYALCGKPGDIIIKRILVIQMN